MNMDLLEAFHQWFSEQRETLSNAGVAMEFVEGSSEDAPSARVDLESDVRMGRATVWESGLCDLELLSVETGEQLLYRHHEQLDSQKLVVLLDELAEQIRQPTS
ncbi:immunity protein TriTu family protein [Myxococcus vastator]|uniref:immunity protein TriTu family protein n=1 Tax=Myxococcus vastator TaxID=2709664 RepID=UPI0013D365D3|nr:hypothetical protein [Myxococcus vastator]